MTGHGATGWATGQPTVPADGAIRLARTYVRLADEHGHRVEDAYRELATRPLSTEQAPPVDDLIIRCDSLLSYIRYREHDGLSSRTLGDLDQLLPPLRAASDAAVRRQRTREAHDG